MGKQKELEEIILSEVTQAQDKCYISSPICRCQFCCFRCVYFIWNTHEDWEISKDAMNEEVIFQGRKQNIMIKRGRLDGIGIFNQDKGAEAW